MKTLYEMPATLLDQHREEEQPVERSRAAQYQPSAGLPGRAHVEPLDATWEPIGDVVVLLLRRL